MLIHIFKKIVRRLLRSKKDTLGYWLEKYLSEGNRMIIQIGANDGKTDDPLYTVATRNENWRMLFVEPIDYLFDRLKQNYGTSTRFSFENVGINSNGESQLFYTIKKSEIYKENGLTENFNQIGSFDKNHVLNLSGQLLGREKALTLIEEVPVRCLTLQQLLDNNGIKTLDALLIDAESYDWQILKQLDLETYHPTIIFFEYTNLTQLEKQEAQSFLTQSYYLFRFGINLLCFSKADVDEARLKHLRKSTLN